MKILIKLIIFLSIPLNMNPSFSLGEYLNWKNKDAQIFEILDKAKNAGDFQKVKSIFGENTYDVRYDMDHIYPDGKSLLMAAATQGDISVVKYLVYMHPYSINLTTYGDKSVERYSNEQVDAPTALYMTAEKALSLAKQRKSITNLLEIIEYLIHVGASTDIVPGAKPSFSELIKQNKEIEAAVKKAIATKPLSPDQLQQKAEPYAEVLYKIANKMISFSSTKEMLIEKLKNLKGIDGIFQNMLDIQRRLRIGDMDEKELLREIEKNNKEIQQTEQELSKEQSTSISLPKAISPVTPPSEIKIESQSKSRASSVSTPAAPLQPALTPQPVAKKMSVPAAISEPKENISSQSSEQTVEMGNVELPKDGRSRSNAIDQGYKAYKDYKAKKQIAQ